MTPVLSFVRDMPRAWYGGRVHRCRNPCTAERGEAGPGRLFQPNAAETQEGAQGVRAILVRGEWKSLRSHGAAERTEPARLLRNLGRGIQHHESAFLAPTLQREKPRAFQHTGER